MVKNKKENRFEGVGVGEGESEGVSNKTLWIKSIRRHTSSSWRFYFWQMLSRMCIYGSVGEVLYDLESKHPTIFRPCLRDSSGKFGDLLL